MKAILEFDLEDERSSHLKCVYGPDAFYVLTEIRNYLRRKYKHAEPKSPEHEEEYNSIKDEINEIVANSSIPDEAFE